MGYNVWVLWRKMTTTYPRVRCITFRWFAPQCHCHQYKQIIARKNKQINKWINCFHLQETTLPLGSQYCCSPNQCLYTATQHRKLMLLQRIQHYTALFTGHCLQMVSFFHPNFMKGHSQWLCWPKPQVWYLVPGQVNFSIAPVKSSSNNNCW